jgi:hypothetical protein
MKRISEKLLSLEVHPLSYGFIVFEGPDQVIDWGVRTFHKSVRVPMKKKLGILIDEYRPRTVLVARTRAVLRLRVLENAARGRGVRVLTFPSHFANKAFPDARNKDERALAVAGRLPALSPYIPPKRKPWKPEHYRMSIFGAAAIGLAHFDQVLREESRN